MKTQHIRSVSLAVAMLAAAVLVNGCKAANYKQADKTGKGIANFQAEILNGKKAVDSTLKALDQVAQSANTDPRKPYEQYVKEVKNLDSVAEKARKRGQDMKEQGQAYFTKWQQELAQVKDPDVRKLAEERKAKLQESFDKIREYTEPLKQQFEPWMSSLKDLQSYLANDLTAQGVAAAKKLFDKAKSDGVKVQKSMDALVEELKSLSATLTPAKGQAGAAPAK
jgi:hypothetical protein